MTTRNGMSVWRVLGLWCLVALAAPVAVRGDGSIAFNGANSAATATSKLQNDGADVLGGANQMTICAWIYRAGAGEANAGVVLTLDETGTSGTSLKVINSGSSLALLSTFTTQPGLWTVPITEDTWTAVAITYDKTNGDQEPNFRMNFKAVADTEVLGPQGNSPTVAAGYCVGNQSSQVNTWDGSIAHLQVFNRVLTDGEADSALLTPGSIRNGLRLWLPMANVANVFDRSGSGFDGTATELGTGQNGPLSRRRSDCRQAWPLYRPVRRPSRNTSFHATPTAAATRAENFAAMVHGA